MSKIDLTIKCDLCGDPFDPHDEPHDVVYWPTPQFPSDKEPLWLCDRNGGHTPEEIAEKFGLPLAHVYQEFGVEYKHD